MNESKLATEVHLFQHIHEWKPARLAGGDLCSEGREKKKNKNKQMDVMSDNLPLKCHQMETVGLFFFLGYLKL